MCGIVGAVSSRDVVPFALARLRLLEYRGYDSYGLATLSADCDALVIKKSVGGVSEAMAQGDLADIGPSTAILGHTRWATHGRVTAENAHPFLSYDRTLAIVHNGIISNHSELRHELMRRGIGFASETDSEVVAHLLALCVEAGATLLDAIRETMARLEGEYAIAVLSLRDPGTVYGAKNGSPLLAHEHGGIGIISSDPRGLGDSDHGPFILEDGDIVQVSPESVSIFRPKGSSLARIDRARLTEWSSTAALDTETSYPHYMLKEIYEVPRAIEIASAVPAEQLLAPEGRPPARPVYAFGAGSSYYVAMLGQIFSVLYASRPIIALPAGEAERLVVLGSGDAVIAISQSGETFDTLRMCRLAVDAGAELTSICNVPNSTQDRIASRRIRQGSGLEVSVLSTKSVISQVVLMARMALEDGRRSDSLDPSVYRAAMRAVEALPATARTLVDSVRQQLVPIVRKFAAIQHWFMVGRGILYPVALESALKFKEATYRHAEGLSASEFKHGPIALVGPEIVTVALIPSPRLDKALFDATIAAVDEVVARDGSVIGIGPGGHRATGDDRFAAYIEIECVDEYAADAVLHLLAGQIFAYEFGVALGRPIDKPRHLAKSVTVA